MSFAHDIEVSLVWSAALINTERNGEDLLSDAATLDGLLDEYEWTGRRDGTAAELDDVRQLRPALRRMWLFDDLDALVDDVNTMLAEAHASPRLARHGDWGWHLHVSQDDAPLATRIMAESAVAFAELVRTDELGRLKACEAQDCDAVLIDLSRNRSRRFCDTGNCGNRANVAAYRARKRADAVD
ncbi:CGNR zinc finger domain-containing protein [Actinomycetes bacterium M1A6_2h]